jgi:hypothetical protein
MPIRSFAAALLVFFASAGYSQTPATSTGVDMPVFRVQVWGHVVADFSTRVASYLELRRVLEKGLPPLVMTAFPAEITRAQWLLARRIRAARKGAKEGEIFTPVIGAEFRKVLLPEMTDETREAIMDDNPGEFSHRIDDTYPRGKTFSTMPSNVLAVLPTLPDDIQYRFLGHHLVLLDTRANVILDQIPCAIECGK